MAKYDDMKKADLISLCEKEGIKYSSHDKKEELIKALEKADAEKAARAASPKMITKKPVPPKTEEKKAKPGSTALPDSDATPRQQRKQEQLWILEQQLETAEELYSMRDSLLRRDIDLKQTVFTQRPERIGVSTEDMWAKEEKISEYGRLLKQSKEDPMLSLVGTIEGTSNTMHIRNGNEEVKYVDAIVEFGDQQVRIPTYFFWDDYYDQRKHPEDRLYSTMQHRIGSEIDFNLLEEKDGKLIGTRYFAMKKNRCSTWYALDDKTGNFLIGNGSVISARIVEMDANYMIVESGGAETTVRKGDITERRIDDIVKETPHYVGQVVKVRVSEIIREKMPVNLSGFEFPVQYRASLKDVGKNPQEENYDKYQFGDTRRAIVKNIYNDLYYCDVLGNFPVTVCCQLVPDMEKLGTIPKKGDEVRIRIGDMDRKRFFIWGDVIYTVGRKSKSEIAFTV